MSTESDANGERARAWSLVLPHVCGVSLFLLFAGDAHPQSLIQNGVGDAPASPTVVPTRTQTELTRKDSHTKNPARRPIMNPLKVIMKNVDTKKKLKEPPPFVQGIKSILFASCTF